MWVFIAHKLKVNLQSWFFILAGCSDAVLIAGLYFIIGK